MDQFDWQQEDWENTIIDFAKLQGEINYQKAEQSLRNVLTNLDLKPEEESELTSEINHLQSMLNKLENSIIQIAAFGMVGKGKSSLLNAIVGKDLFVTGPLHGVTQEINKGNWQFREDEVANSHLKIQKLVQETDNVQIELIDTPGIDEINGEAREELAQELAQNVDLILFVIAGDITRVEYQALCRLREVGKPMILVFNKIDQYPQADRDEIYATLLSRIVAYISISSSRSR